MASAAVERRQYSGVATRRGFPLPLRSDQERPEPSDMAKALWISTEDIRNTDPQVLRNIFTKERAQMTHWVMLAQAFRTAGRIDHFEAILTQMEAKLNDKHEDADERCRETIYTELALYNFKLMEQGSKGDGDHDRRVKLANSYINHNKRNGYFVWYTAMGEYHLNRFIKNRKTEELAKSKEYLKVAMSMRPRNIFAVIYYANTCVMENQIHTAAIFYGRALLLCNYLKLIVGLRRGRKRNQQHHQTLEIEQMVLQLKHVEALLFCALASCRFYENDLRLAELLVQKSLSVMKTPMALRLNGVIAINHILDNSKDAEAEGSSPTLSSPRESLESLIQQWNDSVLEAYVLDPGSIISQMYFCEMLFRQGRIDEAEVKLHEIITRSSAPEVLAEATYHLARCAHVKSDWQKAVKGYNKVLQLRGDYLPARIHLVKVAIGSNNLAVAREHCDYINKYNNKTPDILRLISLVYIASAAEILNTCRAKLLQAEATMADIDATCAMNSTQQDVTRMLDERLYKALGFLEETVMIQPRDYHTISYLIYCLELLVTRGRENMLPKLRDVYSSYMSQIEGTLPVELRNNDAVVALRFRQFDEAVQKLTALWSEIESSETTPITTKITVQYNLALALEESGHMTKAHKMYSTLTRDFPRYTAAWLRKSQMMFKRGKVESAHKYLDELKLHHKKSLDPWLYKAHQFFSMGKFDECIDELRKMFRTVNTASFDAYSNTLFACALIKRSSRGTFGPLPKDVLHYARAGLKRPSLSNFYAANCVAIYLAHEGHLKMAYESFGILLENTSVTSHMKFIAHRNMGLLCAATSIGNERRIERGTFDKMRGAKAQQHLQAALANNRMDINTYIVYARFLYDTQRFEECVQFIEMCRKIFPREIKFTYNMVIAIDAMLCKHFRNSDKLGSATEVAKMLVQAQFVGTTVAHLIKIHERYPKMSKTHLNQIATRAKEKLIPHMEGALPQLETSAAERQVTKGKHLELQMSIQQAHEAKRRQKEIEQRRVDEAYSELSEQLLKEASDIASELMYSRAPTAGNAENR
ncbi:tetratricopeptide repeat-containing protein [Babesia ovis]|uniref:Tetratricopeptide repeat-containing protein n=1 Tax=Babesia ovis TaxID=5869 RepID=A0A9W5WVT8_BABOV|nr:tetratricopeptide repeat-containing protein [Babesia ovis]